jgi:hypothetical protein
LAQTAARILTDAGIEDYYVDDFDFRNTVTDVPIPYDSHATALQAVANFGTSTLEQEDNGKISFRQRYDPPISDWYVVYRPNGYPVPALPFTNIEGIVGESLVTEYAMWEENFFALDGSCCFVPETNDYKNGGMVFNVFPDSDRNYAHPGTRYYMGARIDFTQNRTFGRVVIELSPSNRYQQILVIANRSGIVGELWRKVYTVTGSNLVIDTLFDNIVWLTIYLYNGDIAQRYRIKKVLIERTTGLDLTGQDVLGKIGGTLQPRTKNIDVVGLGTSFWVGGTPPDFTKVTLEPGVLTEIKHTEPMYSVSAYCDDPNVVFDIEEHYAYTSFIQISGVTADTDVKLRGYTYAGTFEQLSRIAMNETGEDVVIENPIAWNNSYLERVCEWVADYYGKRNVYDIETLGYPECDAGDYIVLNGKEAVVLENTLSMNSGAMRGKMKLRGGK